MLMRCEHMRLRMRLRLRRRLPLCPNCCCGCRALHPGCHGCVPSAGGEGVCGASNLGVGALHTIV